MAASLRSVRRHCFRTSVCFFLLFNQLWAMCFKHFGSLINPTCTKKTTGTAACQWNPAYVLGLFSFRGWSCRLKGILSHFFYTGVSSCWTSVVRHGYIRLRRRCRHCFSTRYLQQLTVLYNIAGQHFRNRYADVSRRWFRHTRVCIYKACCLRLTVDYLCFGESGGAGRCEDFFRPRIHLKRCTSSLTLIALLS